MQTLLGNLLGKEGGEGGRKSRSDTRSAAGTPYCPAASELEPEGGDPRPEPEAQDAAEGRRRGSEGRRGGRW